MLFSGSENNGRVVSRYECKYFVSETACAAIREYLAPFVKPDAYAAGREGFCYDVCSLYLDSGDLRLCRMTEEGHKNRFKLRMRRYAEGPDEPVYLEIKRRSDNVVLKSRGRIDLGGAYGMLEGLAGGKPDAASWGDPARAEFDNLARAAQAGPVVRIKYRREAYESVGSQSLRITFDSDLSYSVTLENALSLNGGQWVETDLEGTIMEIKFTGTFPSWLRRLIDVFQLQKQSIPKYVMSMEQAQERGIYRPLADRFLHNFASSPETGIKGS
ncbi:MAG: polyphosphate polymerase domain-containing protein [Proteobacteria bacterium]|nr:polyphosphate polymerase domain-containing protein [Pseudomonadota bacterium]